MKAPELLLPAGSLEKMRAAGIQAGAKLIAQNQQKKTARFVLNSAGNHTSVDFWVDL